MSISFIKQLKIQSKEKHLAFSRVLKKIQTFNIIRTSSLVNLLKEMNELLLHQDMEIMTIIKWLKQLIKNLDLKNLNNQMLIFMEPHTNTVMLVVKKGLFLNKMLKSFSYLKNHSKEV